MTPSAELCNWLISYKAVPDDFTQTDIPSLKRLDLSGRNLKTLPSNISLLENLIALNLSNNLLTTLPESMAAMKQLINLDIRRNMFQSIPKCIAGIALKSLNAGGNQIADITNLSNCSELRVLDLNGNKLSSVNGSFKGLENLRTLNLSFNYLSDISGLLQDIDSVEMLYVNNNLITKLSLARLNITALLHLELSNNRIASIDESFYALELEYLDLSSNELSQLRLKELYDLETLILDDNALCDVTIEESFAPHLKVLSCDGCQLERLLLPPSLFIEKLCFSSNNIVHIPQELNRYRQLQELDIDNNAIVDVDEAINTMTQLHTLYIDGNPLSSAAKQSIDTLQLESCDLEIKPDVIIRKAHYDDIGTMARLIGQLFSIESDFHIDFNKQYNGLKLLFEQPNADILVAKHRNNVIGMITMQRLVSSAEGSFVGLIEDLIIDEEYRKLGIGSRLIAKMQELARNRGYKRIQLAADKSNARALYFYRKRGFKKTNLNIYHFSGFDLD